MSKKSILERLEELVIDYKNYVKNLEKRILELEMQLEQTKKQKCSGCKKDEFGMYKF